LNVLIADDNPESLYMLEALFRDSDYRVYTAADGMAALELIQREHIDVIISDVLMPRMDGFQLCRSVKTDKNLRHIPFIVYTATYTSPQDEAYALKLGAERFILKPAEPEEFLTVVRTVVREAEESIPTAAAGASSLGEEESLRLYSERLAERLQFKIEQAQEEIEARRRTEHKLRESERRLKAAQRLARVGDLTWDVARDKITWSDALFDILGYPKGIHISFEWINNKVHHPEDLPRIKRWLDDALASGSEYLPAFEYRLLRSDGEYIHVHTVGEIRRDEHGNVTVFATIQDITSRKKAEISLRENEQLFRSIYEHSGMGLSRVSLDFRIEHANKAYCDMLGYTQEEIVGMHLKDITRPEILEENLEKQRQLGRGEIDHFRLEKGFIHKAGHTVYGILDANLIRDKEGKPEYFLGGVVDITERKELEQQLLQAQKLESIGRLAGGVAHDYNNMLGVILGSAELGLKQIEPEHPVHARLEQIHSAARRSADITRQLLAFARKQTIAPQVLDLNTAVEQMLNMLRRLIGEEIELTWLPGTDTGQVEIDPVQLDQLLANLCVNARDAISGSGKITIETANVQFDAAYCKTHQGFKPGSYVMLAVSDNGCGMDKETQEHIYEPFFTTKDSGKGTGLGLATVYGIVKQNQGFINLYSEPGRGTTFRIYLTRHTLGTTAPAHKEERSPAGHGQQILVVEDEPTMLELSVMMLEELGYEAIGAQTPNEALRIAKENPHISLLLTDVVMPGMNGRELAHQLQEQHPQLKTLYMSGYTANVIAHHGVLEKGVHFIQKPFSLQDLGGKLKELL
jgi:PAS domain S-box-containing protein